MNTHSASHTHHNKTNATENISTKMLANARQNELERREDHKHWSLHKETEVVSAQTLSSRYAKMHLQSQKRLENISEEQQLEKVLFPHSIFNEFSQTFHYNFYCYQHNPTSPFNRQILSIA